MRKLITALATGGILLGGSASASAHTITIHGDWKIGTFEVKRDGTLRGAVEAFGGPRERERRYGGMVCIARWPEHGLKIRFYNLGGNDACRGRYGFFSEARARGPHWVTNRDLATGDRTRRLRNLYPNARYHNAEPNGYWPAGWWLVRREQPFGAGGHYPGLLATISDRRVQAFLVRYPAGGD